MNDVPFRDQHVHLMGIGGAGVSALVPLLRQVGALVTGCDLQDGPGVSRLRSQGIAAGVGHDVRHLRGVDLLVRSAAVPADHPEVLEAIGQGIPVLTRGQCLVRLMHGTRTVAIAGSHGKSTTTWMTGHLLVEAGSDPVVMVGGGVASLGQGGARAGGGQCFVAETDESDGSFAEVEPEIAVVTNLDREHLGHYGSFAALESAFNGWLRRIPASGMAIVPTVGLSPRVVGGLSCRIRRCGLEEGDWRVADLALGSEGSTCRVIGDGRDLGMMTVPTPGPHMVCNALMAVAAARTINPGVNPAVMAGCERVGRRFTVHAVVGGVRVVEDYGHHPTEVRATIAAARLAGGRVHVLFQPHRYSRTRDCFDDFATAFDQAHVVVVTPVYAAGETPISGATGRALADAIIARRAGLGEEAAPVRAVDDVVEGLDLVAKAARPGDTCLVLGAGDIGRWAPVLVRSLSTPGGEVSGSVPLEEWMGIC